MRVGVLNGPNLNLLGTREPAIYGRETLDEIERLVRAEAEALGASIAWAQTNHEGVLIETLHQWRGQVDGLLLNAAAWSHGSLPLRDTLQAVQIPFVELHLSNVYAREPFRRTSMIADLAIGVVCGFGRDSYLLALRGLVARLRAA